MTVTTITSRAFNQNASGAKRASRDGPVVITERGRPAHVLMSYAEYERLKPPKKSVAEILAMPDGADVDIDLEIPRTIDPPRKQTIIDLLHCPDAADVDIEFPHLSEKPRDFDFS